MNATSYIINRDNPDAISGTGTKSLPRTLSDFKNENLVGMQVSFITC